MLKVKQMRQKAGLAEQGSSFADKAEKEGVCPAGEGWVMWQEHGDAALQGENFCSQSLTGVAACQNCGE